jgi:hypothetical protein
VAIEDLFKKKQSLAQQKASFPVFQNTPQTKPIQSNQTLGQRVSGLLQSRLPIPTNPIDALKTPFGQSLAETVLSNVLGAERAGAPDAAQIRADVQRTPEQNRTYNQQFVGGAPTSRNTSLSANLGNIAGNIATSVNPALRSARFSSQVQQASSLPDVGRAALQFGVDSVPGVKIPGVIAGASPVARLAGSSAIRGLEGGALAYSQAISEGKSNEEALAAAKSGAVVGAAGNVLASPKLAYDAVTQATKSTPGRFNSIGGNLVDSVEKKPNSFTTRVAEDPNFTTSGRRKNLQRQSYEVLTNAQTMQEAKSILSQGTEEAEKQLATLPAGAVKSALAQQLALSYSALPDAVSKARANSIIIDTAVEATKQGQAIQALSLWKKLTPEGAELAALRQIGDYNTKNNKNLSLTEVGREKIRSAADLIQAAPEGIQKDIAVAKLLQTIDEQTPKGIGNKLAEAQTLAQLLNVKTQVRNIGGNLVNAVVSTASDVFGTGVDTVLSLASKQRTKALPNLAVAGKGAVKGGKEAVEYVKEGLRVPSAGGQFELSSSPALNGFIGKKLNNALNASLGVPDKMFYQAAYDTTLESIIRGSGVTEPEQWMTEAAHAEALYRTFQNDSAIGNGLQAIKKALNGGKEFGLGDFVLKYPKTPGNIASVGLDYSPVGAVKGLVSLYRFIKAPTAANQFEVAQTMGRAITGLVAIGGASALAAKGIISGKDKDTKNVDATEQAAGVSRYQFNTDALARLIAGEDSSVKLGDRLLSYDWLQPLAIALTSGAEVQKSLEKDALNAVDYSKAVTAAIADGANSLIDIPAMQGLTRALNNGDIIGGLFSQTLRAAPASFIPTVAGQIRNFVDPTTRQTTGQGLLQDALSQVQNKVPGLSSGLPEQVNVEGKTRQINPELSGLDRALQVFLNPANVSRYGGSKETQEVLRVLDVTGNTDATFKTAPKELTIDGKSYPLTQDQVIQYQKDVGQKTQQALQKAIQTPGYASLSDESKSKLIAREIDQIANQVRTSVKNSLKPGSQSVSNTTNASNAVTKQQEEDAKQKVLSGESNRVTVGNKLFIANQDGSVRTVNLENERQKSASIELDQSITAAKQANDYKQWESLLAKKVSSLEGQIEKLDTEADQSEILQKNNEIQKIVSSVEKFRSQGGFKKPKKVKVSVPKLATFTRQKSVSVKTPRVKKFRPVKPIKPRNYFS